MKHLVKYKEPMCGFYTDRSECGETEGDIIQMFPFNNKGFSDYCRECLKIRLKMYIGDYKDIGENDRAKMLKKYLFDNDFKQMLGEKND